MNTLEECRSCADTRRVCGLCQEPAALCRCESPATTRCQDCDSARKPRPMGLMVCPIWVGPMTDAKTPGICRDCHAFLQVDYLEMQRVMMAPSNTMRMVSFVCEFCAHEYRRPT